MKFLSLFALLFFSLIYFSSCDDEEALQEAACYVDLAMQEIQVDQISRINGVIDVICLFRNVANVVETCSSGETQVRVTSGYSTSLQDSFSDYEVLDERVLTAPELMGNELSNEYPVEVLMSRGNGVYAVKMEALNLEDQNLNNNSAAVAISVD